MVCVSPLLIVKVVLKLVNIVFQLHMFMSQGWKIIYFPHFKNSNKR